MNQAEILHFLKKEYPHFSDEITEKKVRRAVKKMVTQESTLDESCKTFRSCEKNGRITGYWVPDTLSDPELKFLIDSVMYGNIINTKNAQTLAKRLQGLSGKGLREITKYASGAFGKQKYLPDIDVLENVSSIMQAQMQQRKVRFQLNVFDVKDGKIELTPIKTHTVSPLEIFLHSGRYYLAAAYDDNDKVYFFRVDLMTDILVLNGDRARKRDDLAALKNLQRDHFMLKYPVMYGGKEKQFKLRIKRAHFTQLVDTFSHSLMLIPGSDTADTVDVLVNASEGAMRSWLLQYGDIVEALDMDSEFAEKMRASIEILRKKYE